MVKKRCLNETLTTADEVVISSENAPETVANEEEENLDYTNLLMAVQEIRKNEDVLGYILRGESKAAVDLNDPARIIEYAMLSSQAFESSEALAESFNLGEIERIMIEGKDIKTACINLGRNKLSVFMRKNAAHDYLLSAFSKRNNST
jgi:hypothetical protein